MLNTLLIKECISLMQSSDSFHGFGYNFWTFWIIAHHLLYKLRILHIVATSINEETCIVEIRIWCRKIGTVNVINLNHVCEMMKHKIYTKIKKNKLFIHVSRCQLKVIANVEKGLSHCDITYKRSIKNIIFN